MNVTYRIIIEPDKGGFHGYAPALRGCHTWGKTITETRKKLKDAISLYLESLLAHGEIVPEDIGFETFETVELKGKKGPKRARAYA